MTSEFAIAVHALVFLDRSNATIASEDQQELLLVYCFLMYVQILYAYAE